MSCSRSTIPPCRRRLREAVKPLRPSKRTPLPPPPRVLELAADAGLRRELVALLALRMSDPRLAARCRLARAAERCGQTRPVQERRRRLARPRLLGSGPSRRRRLLGG